MLPVKYLAPQKWKAFLMGGVHFLYESTKELKKFTVIFKT